jgi:hypothetical protein
LPPCPAYDFSSALSGTLAWTVEPGEKETLAKFKEAWAASAANVETTVSVTTSWPMERSLFEEICRECLPVEGSTPFKVNLLSG